MKKPVQTVQSWADSTFGTLTPVTQSGKGDNIVTLPAGAKAGIVTATHDGTSNFSLPVLDASNASTVSEETGGAFHDGLLINEIGAYSGTVPLSSGPSVIVVGADGNWTLTAG